MSVVGYPHKLVVVMTDSGPITISEETVRKEGEEIALQARELAARQDRYAKLIEYLRAIGKAEWIPVTAAFTANRATPPETRKGPPPAETGTWTSEIYNALELHQEGKTPVELLGILRTGRIADKAANNPGGIYNAIAKLTKDGKIIKHKGRLFLPAHHEVFMKRVARGETQDYENDRTDGPSISEMMAHFINSRPAGVEAGEVVEHMKEKGFIAGSVYNNLSKIVQKGKVRRDGKLYLPLKNEAPPGDPEGASETTPGGAGTPGTGDKE